MSVVDAHLPNLHKGCVDWVIKGRSLLLITRVYVARSATHVVSMRLPSSVGRTDVVGASRHSLLQLYKGTSRTCSLAHCGCLRLLEQEKTPRAAKFQHVSRQTTHVRDTIV